MAAAQMLSKTSQIDEDVDCRIACALPQLRASQGPRACSTSNGVAADKCLVQMQNAAVRNGMAALDPSWVVDFQDMQFFRAIGEGSFGTVYLGRWHETTVAIKVLAQNKTGVQVELNPSHSAKSHAPGTGCVHQR